MSSNGISNGAPHAAAAIPGPREMPFIGSVRELIAGAPVFLSRLADEYGEYVRFRAFFNTFHLVSRPELIREVLVTKAGNFPKDDRDIELLSRIIGFGLVTTNGASHARQRKLTQPAFHTRRIEAYAGTIVDYTQFMLDGWHDGLGLDVSAAMRELTMYIVADTLFGADRETMRSSAAQIGGAIELLQHIADKEFQQPLVLPTWLPTRLNRDRRPAKALLDATIGRLVAERRALAVDGRVPDTGDLLSMLLLAQDESGDAMSDEEVRDQLLTLFVAGHETTSNALTWTWYLLSQNPVAAERLYSEVEGVLNGRPPALSDQSRLPYTLQVIKEALRLYPPAWLLNTRRAAADTTIGPYPVRKGDLLWISPYAVHRRPEFFPEPERFDPERFTPEREKALPRYAYLPFGGGPRVCIGNSFALMEAHLIVATIAQRYRLTLAAGQVVDLNAQVTLSNHGGMRMTVKRREQDRRTAD